MTATALEVLTLAFPNPEWQPASAPANIYHRIPANISFFYINPPLTLRTLSTTAASPGKDVTGLLYVPDLPPSDPCIELSEPWVPGNVTRQKNLQRELSGDWGLVAMAPWTSRECTLKYLEAARRDPIRGFIFFLPGNGTAEPPDGMSRKWDLGDNDAWKRNNHFPVYAMPAQTGNLLMHASSQYSGNMTEVPHGHLLTETGFDPRDFVRLFIDIQTSDGTTLPSLWVFLLVVLGILLGVIGLTSLVMHLLQRRRRQELRRRVAEGEVDLEALGIKRLTVPSEILDGMPLYVYGSGAPVVVGMRETTSTFVAVEEADKSEATTLEGSSSQRTPPTPLIRSTSTTYRPTPLQQPTCAICLDDFVPSPPTSTITTSTSSSRQPPQQSETGSLVRELPCHHIFHPECVDPFLRDNSSLCPMCKKSVLPRGYCPRVVTNAMVRRERMVRRLRPTQEEEGEGWRGWRGRVVSLNLGMGGGGGRRVSSLPLPLPLPPSSSAVGGREMQEMHPRSVTSPPAVATLSRSQTTTSAARLTPMESSAGGSRGEFARERAIAMLGRHRASVPLDPDAEDARLTSGWRKAVGGVFPGLLRR